MRGKKGQDRAVWKRKGTLKHSKVVWRFHGKKGLFRSVATWWPSAAIFGRPKRFPFARAFRPHALSNQDGLQLSHCFQGS